MTKNELKEILNKARVYYHGTANKDELEKTVKDLMEGKITVENHITGSEYVIQPDGSLRIKV